MPDFVLFLGRFHPLVLHLPIGLLAAVAFLELAAFSLRHVKPVRRLFHSGQEKLEHSLHLHLPGLEVAIRVVLVLAALSAVLAAVLGLMLAARGEFAGSDFTLHKWLGLATAAAAALAALLRPARFADSRWPRSGAYAAVLGGALLLLSLAGHYGGVMVHGEPYLSQHAPRWIPAWVPAIGRRPEAPAATPTAAASEYDQFVRPLLDARCVSCHGAGKFNGNLRLDTLELAQKAGATGRPAIVPGDAARSEMVRRLLLPEAHAEFMPPKPERPLAADEVLRLARWVQAGAPTSAQPAAPTGAEAVKTSEPVSPAALAKLAEAGILAYPQAEHSDLLVVDLSRHRALGDAELALLAPLAGRIVDLNVSGTQVTDRGLGGLPALPALRSFRAHHTGIGGAGIARIVAGSPQLEYAGLSGLKEGDGALAALGPAKELREATLSGMPLSVEALRAFVKAHPRTRLTHALIPLPDFNRPPLALLGVNSEERNTGDYRANNLFDGKLETIWHTQYKDSNIPPPYFVDIENVHRANVVGLVMVPRQDNQNGTPKEYEIQASADRKTWVTVSAGTAWGAYDKEPRAVVFATPQAGPFFRLVVKSAHGGQFGSLAELRLYDPAKDGGVANAGNTRP